MKKLLTILGATGLVATTGATVVACGNPTQTEDPFKEIKDQFKWGIEAYEKTGLSIWPLTKDFTGYAEDAWLINIWTGILTQDNPLSALRDYVANVQGSLHLTMNVDLETFNTDMTNLVKEAIENGNTEIKIPVELYNLGLTLDKDIQSWTLGKDEDNEENNKGKITKSVIKTGEMKFTELTIKFSF